MNARRSVTIAFVLALLAGACSKGGGSPAAGSPSGSPTTEPTATATATPTETPSESPSESPSPTPEASPALEDGRHFGYIKSMDLGSDTLVFDLAYMLTGEAAVQAAVADGVIQPGEDLPNGYYIQNNNPLLRTLDFVPNVSILVVNWPDCCESTSGELEPFTAEFQKKKHTNGLYYGSDVPYWLTIDGGVIVAIEEQYLP